MATLSNIINKKEDIKLNVKEGKLEELINPLNNNISNTFI